MMPYLVMKFFARDAVDLAQRRRGHLLTS